VRDFIDYFPMVPDTWVYFTLHNRVGSCLGKSIILTSLYCLFGVRDLGKFKFDELPNRLYSKAFCEKENFCFNQRGFAIISQLNLIRSLFYSKINNWLHRKV